MYRCMTCDERKKGSPDFIEVSPHETIGLCPECITIVRSFNTLKALAAGEYEREAKCGEAICCDDSDCPDKDGFSCTGGKYCADTKEAREIAKSIVGPTSQTVFIDIDAPVEIHPNEIGNGRHAWVPARVYVELEGKR